MIQVPRPIAETADTLTFVRAEVEDFIEALETREAKQAFAATRSEEKLPAALVQRLAAGGNPVRLLREHRGLSAAALAARSGIAASYLSEIETGQKPGSARALVALARALAVEVDDLVT